MLLTEQQLSQISMALAAKNHPSITAETQEIPKPGERNYNSNQFPMKSKLEETLTAQREALKTVEYQITHLQKYYSYDQCRVWKKMRKQLRKKIKFNEQMLAARNAERERKRVVKYYTGVSYGHQEMMEG
jgi:hypothetical protein